MLKPDFRAMRSFLSAIDPEDDRWCFQCISDKADGAGALQPIFGRLPEDHLATYQQQGYAAYFVLNRLKEGVTRRTNANIDRIRGLFADIDGGCTLDRLKKFRIEPSFITETSPGKYHVIWLVDGMSTSEAQGYTRALVHELGGDKGVNDIARLLRLPGSIHQKGKPFKVKLVWNSGIVHWASDLKEVVKPMEAPNKGKAVEYVPPVGVDVEALVSAWIGNIPKRKKLWAGTRKDLAHEDKRPDGSRYDMAIASACRADGLSVEVFDVLVRAWRRIHGDNQNKMGRRNYIANTWGKTTIGAVKDPSETWADRKKRIEAIKSVFAGEDGPTVVEVEPDEPEVDAIKVSAARLHDNIYQAAEALGVDECGVYRRGAELVYQTTLNTDLKRDGVGRDNVPVLLPYNKHSLKAALTEHASWVRWSKGDKDWMPCGPSDDIVNGLLCMVNSWEPIKSVTSVVRSPVMTLEGEVIAKPGWYKDSGILYAKNGHHEYDVPSRVSKKQAKAALETLRKAIGSFPFVDAKAESVALASMLTAFMRPFLPTAPMFLIDAPTAGTGKTLLANVLSTIATGGGPTTFVPQANDESDRKMIHSLLLEGSPSVLIDNIKGSFDSTTMNIALTSPTLSDRRLGRSEIVGVSTRTVWFGTGNNLSITGDMRRRVLVCRIDAKCEHPEEREFEKVIINEVKADRKALVEACLTILVGYQQAKAEIKAKPFGSFEEWSQYVRDPLLWLGMPNPCDTRELLDEGVTENDIFVEFLNKWVEAFGAKPVTTKDFATFVGITSTTRTMATVQQEKPAKELMEAFRAFYDTRERSPLTDINSLKLGHFFKSIKDEICGGRRFVMHKRKINNMTQWLVENI